MAATNRRDAHYNITSTDRTGRAVNSATRNVDRLRRNTENAGRSMQRASARSNNFGQGLGKLVVRSTAAIVAFKALQGAAQGVSTAFQTYAFNERAAIGLETLTGSAEAAKKKLAELKEFSKTTPFNLKDLAQYTRQMIGVKENIDGTIPSLRAWGDASAAMGLSADQFQRVMLARNQIMAKGQVYMEELRQIQEAGIPITQLFADALNLTTGQVIKLTEEGKLLSKEVMPHLEAQFKKEYGGAMGRQAKTLSGLWENLTETFQQSSADAIAPMIPALERNMPQAIKATAASLRFLGRTVSATMAFLRALRDGTREWIDEHPKAVAVLRNSAEAVRKLFAELSGEGGNDALNAHIDIAMQGVTMLAGVAGASADAARAFIKAAGAIVHWTREIYLTLERAQKRMEIAWLQIHLDAVEAVEKIAEVASKVPGAGKVWGGVLDDIRAASGGLRGDLDKTRAEMEAIGRESVKLSEKKVYANYGGDSAARARYAAANVSVREMLAKEGKKQESKTASGAADFSARMARMEAEEKRLKAAAEAADKALDRVNERLSEAKSVVDDLRGKYDDLVGSIKEAIAGKSLVDRFSELVERMNEAQERAKEKAKELKDTYKDLRQAAIDALKGPSVAERGTSARDIVRSLNDELNRLKKFQAVLKGLKAAGLNEAMFQDFAAKGPAALESAMGLLRGGKIAIDAANRLGGEIKATQGLVGTFVAGQTQVAADLKTAQGRQAAKASFQDLVKSMKDDVAASKKFQGDLGKLKGLGLNAEALADLASRGTEAQATVTTLLAGGREGIAQINKLGGKLSGIGEGVGRMAAEEMYSAKIRSAEMIVRKITAEQIIAAKRSEDAAARERHGAVFSDAPSWAAIAGQARTGGPAPVHVDSRIFLDSQVLDARTTTIVDGRASDQAWRVRTRKRW